MNQLLNSLKFHTPQFKINTAQIEILKDPVDFYVNLHRGIRASTKRIIWSSLYMGLGNLEDFLTESICTQQRKYEQLRVSILLDFYRGMREDPKSFSASVKHLKHLRINNLYAQNMKLGLMRHPFLPKIADLMNKTSAREIFNVHHMKWYIFDDKVILTGANLQEEYFTHRQDRYMVFHEVPEIADYLDDAQSTMMQHAFLVEGDEVTYDQTRAEPTNRSKYFNEFMATWKMFNFSYKDQVEEIQSQQQQQQQQEDEKVQEQENEGEETVDREDMLRYFERDLILEEKMETRKQQVADILSKSFNKGDVQNIVTRLDKTLYKYQERNLDEGEDAYIFISLHIPYLKSDEDQKLFSEVLKFMDEDQFQNIYWVTGYMNFTQQIIRAINNCKANIKLLTASPKANGFYNGGKYKKYIPYLYRIYETQLTKPIMEYYRPSWTFHAKGFWGELKDNSTITIIGSSNYAERSLKRDNEIQMYIITQCPMFKQELQEERNRLFKYAEPISLEQIENDKDIKLGWKTRFYAKIFKSLL